MKKVFYWAPCLDKVGTFKSTINSALSLVKFSKKFNVYIINTCGEWESEKYFFERNDVKVIDLNFNYFKYLPKKGFFKSRFSFLIISLFSIIPLVKLIKKEKPDYFIAHLITLLPLSLFNLINFKTKFILRISGFPKLNFLRKFFWRNFSKKIFKVTCPSNDLMKQLTQNNIFQKKNILFLPDPIIRVEEYLKKINKKNLNLEKIDSKYFISVGRLTKQKNFKYLINEFKEFNNLNENYNLLIFGNGEEEKTLKTLIKNLNLSKKVFLMGYSENIYFYMKKSSALILSSLWEDPGFVIIEAAMCNTFVISSDCKNGPTEFLENGQGGLLYKSNEKNFLSKAINDFVKMSNEEVLKKKIKAKKNCYNYTLARHFFLLSKILNS